MSTTTTDATTNGHVPRHLDLDAARRARAEKRGKPPTITFLGREWVFPHALPADVIDLVAEVESGNTAVAPQAIKMMLGGPVYAEMLEAGRAAGEPVDTDDMADILGHLLSAYEVNPGESSASGGPS